MDDTWKYFAACLLGFAIAGWAGQVAAVGIVEFLHEWQSLIAGTAALIGAWMTVRAMLASYREAKAVISSYLSSKFAIIDVIWEFVDEALSSPDDRELLLLYVRFADTEFRFDEWTAKLSELNENLSPRDKMNLDAVITEFQVAQRIIETPIPTVENAPAHRVESLIEVWLERYRIAFSRIRHVAIKFDPKLAEAFEGRTVRALDNTSPAEALRDTFREKLNKRREEAGR
ncbi:hypothetical protein [Breoghania sp.]|uniref:hypothetical protein n=1 Tax=Breoghania sp. TaxID=2065378 RepID=UPI002AAAF934|nr:hypothetical protein [Breoghania sp.]